MARTSRTAAGRNTRPIDATTTVVAAAAYHPSSTTATAGLSTSTAASTSVAAVDQYSVAKQPKTVLDKIVWSIRKQQNTGAYAAGKGVSRLAIAKFLKNELYYDNANAIKTALKKGVEKGVLETQTGQSFRVKGDPVVKSKEDSGPKLVMEDVVVGTSSDGDGDNDVAAQVGDTVTVGYVGKLDNGHVFDAASSFTFVLGAGDVIKGWDQGVKGMRVGGKRKLVVPPKLGYGQRGSGSSTDPDHIPAGATLHFVVTLKSLVRPEA